MKSKRGFTLIEVVAAVAVAALILSAAYGVVTTTIASQRRAEELLGAYKEGAAIMRLVCEDLRGATFENNAENFSVADEQEFPSFGFSGISWDPATGRIRPARVGYEVERKGDLLRLLRTYSAVDPGPEEAGGGVLVTDRIDGWAVEYFDGQEWLDTWEDSKELPAAVRVEFTLKTPGREPVRFVRETSLPAQRMIESGLGDAVEEEEIEEDTEEEELPA